jgi:sarcosine oxidase, subunit gamma
MSEFAVSALDGLSVGGLVTIREMGRQGMVSLRADLGEAAKAVARVTGADMPAQRQISAGKDCAVAWMSPDELLILCDADQAGKIAFDLSETLTGQHHLALDISDARAMFSVTGQAGAIRDVLAKITPADIGALGLGEMRRTRLQQVAGAIWFQSEGEARVICFRSVAAYVFDLLAMSARDGGRVGYHG